MLDVPERDIEVFLVRHGEVVGQDGPRVVGRGNELPLTSLGIRQAKEVGKALKTLSLTPNSVVYCSPAKRAEQTAQVALDVMKSGLEGRLVEHWALSEVSQGDWEGRLRREVHTAEARAQMEAEGLDFVPPRGESLRQCGERLLTKFLDDEFRGHHPARTTTVLAFGHGLVTRCAAGLLEGWSIERILSERVPNTSATKFIRHKGRWRLEFLGKSALEI